MLFWISEKKKVIISDFLTLSYNSDLWACNDCVECFGFFYCGF